MSGKLVKKHDSSIFFFLIIFFLLTASLLNLKLIFSRQKVLGAETQINEEEIFWNDFLNKNPKYLPGLIETGNIDQATNIDPNFGGLN